MFILFFLYSNRKHEEDPREEFLLTKISERFCEAKQKCEETLYGELLVEKLKKLPYETRLRAKHDIDNIMFKYLTSSIISSPILSEPSALTSQQSHQQNHYGSPVFDKYPSTPTNTTENTIIPINNFSSYVQQLQHTLDQK